MLTFLKNIRSQLNCSAMEVNVLLEFVKIVEFLSFCLTGVFTMLTTG